MIPKCIFSYVSSPLNIEPPHIWKSEKHASSGEKSSGETGFILSFASQKRATHKRSASLKLKKVVTGGHGLKK